MQARFCGLPDNTPLVEQVEVDAEAGAPRTALQIAADKYRQRAPPAKPAPSFPEPKKRDQFLEFPVMPCAIPPAFVSSPKGPCSARLSGLDDT